MFPAEIETDPTFWRGRDCLDYLLYNIYGEIQQEKKQAIQEKIGPIQLPKLLTFSSERWCTIFDESELIVEDIPQTLTYLQCMINGTKCEVVFLMMDFLQIITMLLLNGYSNNQRIGVAKKHWATVCNDIEWLLPLFGKSNSLEQ